MTKLVILYFAALLAILSPASLAAQSNAVSNALSGNWFNTDGSNRFVIGIYNQAVCYKNNTWKIKSISKHDDRWQLAISNGVETANLDVQLKDSNTIVLSNGNRQLALKNIRTYNYNYKAAKQVFNIPVINTGLAIVRGIVKLPAATKRTLKNSYAEISYYNEFTGEPDFFLKDMDSTGCFVMSFPVYKFQLCTLRVAGQDLGVFFVQPGSDLLIAVNKEIEIVKENPDYSKVMQGVAVMGDDEDFNNLYQHYRWYSAGLGYPAFKFPFETVKGKPAAEKKGKQFAYYNETYKKCLAAIDNVYPAGRTEQRFIDYIKNDVKYTMGIAILDNLRDDESNRSYKIDSSDLLAVYKTFIEQSSPFALMYASYYKLAKNYSEKLNELITGNRYSYSISPGKMDERIKNDYGPIISGNFLRVYNEFKKDYLLIGKMKDEEIIEKYFNGKIEEAQHFKFIQRKISNEFFKEARDSARYEMHKKYFSNASFRFAANLSQLLDSRWSDDDVEFPSLYRIKLFNNHVDRTTNPGKLVDSLNTGNAVNLALASFRVKLDETLIKEVNDENNWQTALKKYRGKTVVVWMFSHYFEEERALRSLYELQKMQDKYKGKNVVFLKCIQQRQRSDKVKMLIGYLRLMKENDALEDIYYINREISIGSLMSESINGNCVIYNESGLGHHPSFYQEEWNRRNRDEFTLEGEIDLVMNGKGRYFEGIAYELFAKGGRYYTSGGGSFKTWTLYASAGNYFTYAAKEPDKPVYGKEQDTVFSQISFLADSLYLEHAIVLLKMPAKKSANSFLNSPVYRKEMLPQGESYLYNYDKATRILTLTSRKDKKQKRLKVVAISLEVMVLELLQ